MKAAGERNWNLNEVDLSPSGGGDVFSHGNDDTEIPLYSYMGKTVTGV